tara:strand:- start:490 stop:744 length:255 start_codon:yes stop_codon:yes gene_type:complete
MNYRIFDNEANNSNRNPDFLRPKMSNESKPIKNNHENYIFDRNAEIFYKNNMGNYMQPNTSRDDDNNHVQSCFRIVTLQIILKH